MASLRRSTTSTYGAGAYGARAPNIITGAQKYRELEAQRTRDFKRDSQISKLQQDRILIGNAGSESRVANKRRLRLLHQREQEEQMAIALDQRGKMRQEQEAAVAQEEKLAREISRVNRQRLLDEKMRQQIRDTDPELRALEAKLRAGYTNMELAAQIAEKEAEAQTGRLEDAQTARAIQRAEKEAQEDDRRKEIQRYQDRVKYQSDLESQLAEQEQERLNKYQEFLREKQQIDDIVNKIYQEDMAEREEELRSKRETARYIDEFKRDQEAWREQEKASMEMENEKIKRHAEEQSKREAARQAEQAKVAEAKEELQKKLGQKIQAEEHAKREMEEIRMELVLEEQEEAARKKELKGVEDRIRRRLEMQQAYVEDIEFKQAKKEQEMLEEAEFRRRMMEKFAHDDKIEQMNAQKRRMRQLDHKRAVEALIEERRQRFAFEKEMEMRAAEEDKKLNARKIQIIEEERQRLIKEHAEKLLGYLPKGVLKEDDLGMMSQRFQDAYKPLPVDDDDFGF